jgi:hypothetical protein
MPYWYNCFLLGLVRSPENECSHDSFIRKRVKKRGNINMMFTM